MEKQPILSICIPTDGSAQWVLPVLDSIYSQDADMEMYEVVITDNGEESQLPQYISKYNYPNLRYRQTNDKGFLNLVTALKDGKGEFCKMLNHRSILHPGTIERWIKLINKYRDTKPIIYCADARVKGGNVIECADINEFLINLSVYATWSAGIGLWQEDISNINKIKLDEMFPNASMLLNIRDDARYVIWNYKYQTMREESAKGWYDYYYTFSVRFLDILTQLRINCKITDETFMKVKKDMFHFLSDIYLFEVMLPSKNKYLINNIKSSFGIYYGSYYYWKMLFACILKYPLGLLKCIWRKYHVK